MLGPVGAAEGPQARALFRRTAGKQLGNATTAFGVAAVRQGRLTVVGVGDGPAEGAPLNAARRALFQRALNQKDGKLVSGILKQNGQRRLVLAMKVEGTRAVVYRGPPSIRPGRCRPPRTPLPWPASGAVRRPTAKPSNLIVKTEGDRGVAGAAQGARGGGPVAARGRRTQLAGTLASQFPGSSWPAGW